ncbi:MAG: SDR family NAD(P)-dependent oxidoreductase [Pseudomonadota bacterium]
METLAGKTAFITGAASGIGYAMAETFAKAGMRIILADMEASALDTAYNRLNKAGFDVAAIQVDVTDRHAMAKARDDALTQYDAIHLLCNNAGVNAAGPLDKVSYNDWDWVLGVNLGGVVNGLMTFLPELKRHGTDAHIVNTASVGGLIGMANIGVYNASKFAVVGLSEALRIDMLPYDVGVSVLCPGVVRTSLGTSERNRPGHLRDAELSKSTNSNALETGTDPLVIAADVLAAVKEKRFFITTHPEFQEFIAARNATLDASFQGEVDPATVEAMRGLIRPF